MKFKTIYCVMATVILSGCTVNRITSNEPGTIESAPYLSKPLQQHTKILVVSTMTNNQIYVENGFSLHDYPLAGMNVNKTVLDAAANTLTRLGYKVYATDWHKNGNDDMESVGSALMGATISGMTLGAVSGGMSLSSDVKESLQYLKRGKDYDYILIVNGRSSLMCTAMGNYASPIKYSLRMYLINARDFSTLTWRDEQADQGASYSNDQNVQLCKSFKTNPAPYEYILKNLFQNYLPNFVSKTTLDITTAINP